MSKALLAVVGLAMATTGANAQLSIVNNLPGTFMDISGTGTFIDSTDDSEHTITSTVGNNAFPAGMVRIGNNGAVASMVSTGDISFVNNAIPAVGHPSGVPATAWDIMYPFWDDLIPTTAANSGIYHQEMDGNLIIQWNEQDHFGAPGTGTVTFQLKIFGSGPVLAQFIYQDAEFAAGALQNNGGSATIGFSTLASTGNNNVQWSFNTMSISSGTVLSLVPAPGSAALLGLGGLLAARRRRA